MYLCIVLLEKSKTDAIEAKADYDAALSDSRDQDLLEQYTQEQLNAAKDLGKKLKDEADK